jgi:aminopeptidase N
MARSLLRTEASARAATVTSVRYTVDLDLTAAETAAMFRSTTTAQFDGVPGGRTFIDLEPSELVSVTLNGSALDVAAVFDAGAGRISLTALAERNELVVVADMAYSHDGEGLHKHTDPADGLTYLYATSALNAAPRWFACFDQPDVKATVTLTVSCPSGWTVIANGAGTQVAHGRWDFATTRAFSTYIATVCAGPWASVVGEHDGVRLGVHARASLAEHLEREAVELLAVTADSLDELHRLFGIRYPWGEYHQVFCPDFNWGAMENPGCVTFRDTMIYRGRSTDAERAARASTVAHEMAHMWFGNLVTFAWWDDLWLNESFAEYLGHRVIDAVTDYDTWTDFGIVRKAWGYAADRRPSTHPIAGNGIADVATALNEFDGISYAKGAAVLRQLAARLGDELFFGGLRAYFAKHAYGNATFADLLAAWTEAGAEGLAEWAEQWLRTSGLDTLTVRDGFVHRTAPGQPADRPHATTLAAYDGTGAEIHREALRIDSARTPAAAPLGAALVLPDAEDESWAKLSLSAAEYAALPGLIAALPARARVATCNAVRLAVADAELDPAAAVRIAAAALAHEPDDAVVASMGRWALDVPALTYLPAGGARDDAVKALANATSTRAASAPAGSGLQLVAARAYIGTSSNFVRLAAWLEGDAPPGLQMDQELRWTVLAHLVANGAAGPEEIEAELRRDASAQGATHAARCRALVPTAEAKATAWQLIFEDRDASNYTLYATAEGFWHAGQNDLTEPYVQRFFEQINHTATLRSGWVVDRLALYAYPHTAVAQRTVELTEALLAQGDLDPGIRRSVIDAGDDLRRAVLSRSRFA